MLPPVQEFEGACCSGDFVTEVVGPAAICVDVVEMLMQFFREQPGNYVEIFVMMGCEPARVVLRGFRRAARRRRVRGDFEFVRTQHLLSNVERVKPFLGAEPVFRLRP